MDIPNQNLKTLSDVDADIMLENLTSKAVKTLSSEDSLLYEYFIASPYMADFDDLNSNEHKIFLGSYSNFPMSLKTFIAASQTANVIYAIGKEYNLKDSKISQLSSSVRELVTGKIFIQDFPAALSLKLGLDNTKTGEMTNKLISKSFAPIIEDVKRIQRSKFPEKIMQLQKEGRSEGLTKPPLADVQPPKKPEVKIPNLGEPITKEDDRSARKSLEEELEKVASVIDLRSNPKE